MIKESEIFKYLKIDREAEESITSQLIKGLENLIKSADNAERLPSEREIAEKLDISRVTVRNALKKLKERNILKIYGRSGTYISEKTLDAKLDGIHPMAFAGLSKLREKEELKLLLYENIPFQKNFWESAVNEYNSINQANSIKIEWVPLTITSESDYTEEFLRSNDIDIFQFSLNKKVKSLAAELPEDMVNDFNNSEKYFCDVFLPETKECFKFIAPLHFNMVLTFWNPELAEKAELKNVRERIRKGEINEMIAEASEKLPDDCKSYGHIWDRVAYMGRPQNSSDINIAFFTDVLKKLEGVKDFRKAYILEQKHSFETVEFFNNGKILFLEAPPSCAFVCGKIASELLWEPCHITDNYIMPAAALGLAVSRHSYNYEASIDFIKFMQSDKIQEMSASDKLNPPFLKSSLCGMSAVTDDRISENYLSKNIKQYCVFDNNPENEKHLLMLFMVFHIRRELADMCDGKLSLKKTAFIINEKWQHELNRG